MREGRPDQEIMDYLKQHAPLTDDEAQAEFLYLKRYFCESYTFKYCYGRNLLEPWLTGRRSAENLRWPLNHQVIPSELEHARKEMKESDLFALDD